MKKRHSPEQIVRKLRQADEKLAFGASVPEVARPEDLESVLTLLINHTVLLGPNRSVLGRR